MLHQRARAMLSAGVLGVLAACGGDKITPTGTGTTTTTTTPLGTLKANPCGAAGTISVPVATTAKFDCSAGGSTITLAGGGASYFVLTQFAGNQAAFNLVAYKALIGTPAAASVVASGKSSLLRRASYGSPIGGGTTGLPLIRPRVAQMTFDKMLRARAAKVASSGGTSAMASRLRASRRSAAVAATPAAGSIRSFHVASNFAGTTYATVAARLAYAGNNVLVYVDTLAPAGFTAAQLQAYGALFDQTLYPIDTGAFGSPSDADNNGHVVMLMSQVVNGDTPKATCASSGYIAGFFDPNDFSTTDPNSNQGEIFYSVVPDPSGVYSCAHTVADIDNNVPATFLHELQHLINYSQHAVIHGIAPLDSWLDEGMSITAEELGSLYYEAKCPPPSCRTNSSQLFPDSAEAYTNGFLYDSYQYALLPDTASILLEDDSEDGFSWRGGAWLFTRWIADQYGNSALKALETGPSDATVAIATATGQAFGPTFADFGVALYTDSLPGLARSTAPAINRFKTRNLRQLWARLYATSASSDIPTPAPLYLASLGADTTTYVMYPGTMSYWRVDTPATATAVTLQFSTPTSTALAAILKPQITVFRLPSGQ
jgi:hypothetical protein